MYTPKNAAQLFKFQEINLSRESAYTKAVDIIMEDPRYRICQISWCDGDSYSLCCWQAAKKAGMNYDPEYGEHVLFYSKTLFLWKDFVPTR